MEARAKARYVRLTPRKARRVVDLIRGLPADQAAGSDPATANADEQKDQEQTKAPPGNGLRCPLCSLNLPPAPFDIPPPIQVTVPVGVSLGLPSLPLLLPPPQLPPPPQVPLPPPPSIPLPPPPF